MIEPNFSVFPSWKYHKDYPPKLVKSREEYEALIKQGWCESPADCVSDDESAMVVVSVSVEPSSIFDKPDAKDAEKPKRKRKVKPEVSE